MHLPGKMWHSPSDICTSPAVHQRYARSLGVTSGAIQKGTFPLGKCTMALSVMANDNVGEMPGSGQSGSISVTMDIVFV